MCYLVYLHNIRCRCEVSCPQSYVWEELFSPPPSIPILVYRIRTSSLPTLGPSSMGKWGRRVVIPLAAGHFCVCPTGGERCSQGLLALESLTVLSWINLINSAIKLIYGTFSVAYVQSSVIPELGGQIPAIKYFSGTPTMWLESSRQNEDSDLPLLLSISYL